MFKAAKAQKHTKTQKNAPKVVKKAKKVTKKQTRAIATAPKRIAQPATPFIPQPIKTTSIFGSTTNFNPFNPFARRRFSASPVTGNVGDIVGFPLADIGEGITEVEVLQWFINKGDKIEQFQKICEVQSDKANVEITSRYDGIVESLEYAVGQMAQVGTPLIKLKLTSATANAPKKTTEAAPVAAAETTTAAACPLKAAAVAAQSAAAAKPRRENSCIIDPPRGKDEIFASPVVRLRASAAGINLGAVKPTGTRGQITREDLEAYIAEVAELSNAVEQPTTTTTTTTTTTASTAASAETTKAAKPVVPVPARGVGVTKEDQVHTVTGIQKVMVKTMTAAASIPTLGFADEVVMDNLVAIRSQLKDKAKAHGVKLSNFAFIIKALSLALEKYPQVNAHVNSDCSQITYKAAHNIGLAMDTPKGLLVPNIKNVQSKSILEIGAELNRLQALGAAGKLGQDDLKGGTITLSNIGTIGGTYCQPILVVPEAAICALGKMVTKPAFDKNGQVYPQTVMNIGWTADHRALDGATVARFSNEFKNYMENPHEMLLY